jgi:hypothetical protein
MNRPRCGALVLSVLLAGAPAVAQVPAKFGLEAPQPISGLKLQRIFPVDVDGDGDLDVLGTAPVFFSYTALYLLRNDGNGQFTNVTTQQMPGFLQRIYLVTPFDCDGDGDVDLFLSGNAAGSNLLRNDGHGTFTVAATLANVPSKRTVAGDLDGDGDLDLALAPDLLLGGLYQLLINSGGGSFSQGPNFGNSALAGVAVFDLDADGDLDVFYPSSRQLLRNDGGLVFTDVAATQLLVLTTFPLPSFARGDLDGDGDGDFVFAGAPDFTVLHQGNTLTVGASLSTQPLTRAVALADVDRDGDLDVVRGSANGSLSLSLNDGLGGFTDAPQRLPPFPIYSDHLHAADLDRDGDADLLSCFQSTTTLLLRNRHVHVEVGAALRGQNWNVELWSEPGYAVADGLGVLAVSLARLPAPLPLPPFGNLWLDPNGALQVADSIPQTAGRRTFAFAIPAAPQLVGIELNVQGLVAAASGGVRLTALGITTIQ